MNKKLYVPALVIMLIALTTIGVSAAYAQDTSAATPQASLIQKQENQAANIARFEEKLTQLIADGKITETQKLAIINKGKELQTKRGADRLAMQNMTPQQRKDARQKQKTEVEQWTKENNIDIKYLKFGFMSGRKGHMHF